MVSGPALSEKSREQLFVLLVIIVWAAAFGVYLVNSADASLWGLSRAYAFSLLWWLVAVVVLVAYAVVDVRGG